MAGQRWVLYAAPMRRFPAAHLATTLACLLATGLAAMGCGGNNRKVQHAVVERRAPFDFQCPRESLRISHMGGDLWAVEGCGMRAVYNTNGLCSDLDNCDPAIESRPTPAAPAPPPR
jgi:hypothetical protein